MKTLAKDYRTAASFALFGAISGSLATAVIFLPPLSHGFETTDRVDISTGSLAPGLFFGVIIGVLLARRQLIKGWLIAGYILASTLSYYAAYTLATNIYADLEILWLVGMIAGLAGSACLTGVSALIVPAIRRLKPCLVMIASGCLLGALLELVLFDFIETLIFFAVWQGGYAASLAAALPQTDRPPLQMA